MMMEVDDEQEGNEMDVSNANFISSLSNPLRGYAETCFPPQSNGNADEKESIPTQQQQQQRLDEFEISVRSHLLELIEQLLTAQDNNDDDDDDAALTTLLQYLKDVSLLCLHISIKTQSSTSTSNNITAIKKLPFLLIEDTIDSLPLTLIQRVWSSSLHPSLCISSYINNNTTNNNQSTSVVVLTSPQLFIPTSKFVLLRICNKLLRLLSSSSNNNNNDDANFAGEIMLLLAQVFPLSERSAMNVLGGFNVGNVCRVEGLEEFEQRSSGGGGDGGSSSVGYEFYSKFWGVQKVFTDPAGTILTSSTSARGGGGGGSANDRVQAYESFIKDVTDILEAFESTPIVEQDNKIGDGNDKNQSTDEEEQHHPVQKHHKYLTNSQLLHLQLKDPTLRIHFLTQLLIILSYLSTLPPSLLPTGVQSTAGADTSKLMGQIRQTQLKQLGLIEKRVQKLLLRATTSAAGSDVNNNSSGSSKNNGMWKALQWILRDRESMWKNWKKAKCLPAMDRVTTTTAAGGGGGTTYTASGSDVQKLLLAGKKRKLDTSSSTNPSGSGARSSSTDTFTIETLAQVTSEIKTSAQPTLTAFFDPYVEALDPENGIEGEYHPKNDKVYTWRGLRLMARDYQEDNNEDGHLKRFGKLRRKDGDFEGIVRDIWKEKGEEIPGKMPEDYYQEDIEEEEEVSGTGAGAGGKTDAEMDDVSVGSTQEAAIAKKEEEEAKKKRMAEFEKAAMEVEEDILDENEKTAAGTAVDEGTKSNRSSYASLADAVITNTKSEESAKEDKKKDEKLNEVKKDEKAESKKEEKSTESKKEDGKDVKKEENGSKKGSPNSRSTKKGTPNSKSAPAKKDDGKNGGGKGKKEADNGKKDESKGSTKTNNSKGSDNNKNDSKQQTRSRAKFTPPQKVQQQHQNKSEPQRDNSNSRSGGGGGGGGRRGGNDRRGNNMPPPQPQPPQSRGGNRDGHGRAHTPPGGPSPRGGDQRGNNGPPRGGGGPGRGWEPPPGKFHPGQGGGGGRGGGGGGGRPRRHGRR